MRNLEKRLEKLEQVYSPPKVLVIVLDLYTGGEALGVKLWDSYRACPEEDFDIKRSSGESEEALLLRAEKEGKAYIHAHPALRQDYITLRLEREFVRCAKPEPGPEPIPEARAAPKAQPEQREITVIRHLDGLILCSTALVETSSSRPSKVKVKISEEGSGTAVTWISNRYAVSVSTPAGGEVGGPAVKVYVPDGCGPG